MHTTDVHTLPHDLSLATGRLARLCLAVVLAVLDSACGVHDDPVAGMIARPGHGRPPLRS